MASPDLFPSKERQTSRGYAGAPHLHQEISHLLGDPESDDEDLPPYPGLSSRDGTIEFCFGPAPVEGRRSQSKERHVSESEQPSCQISAVWYRRGPGAALSSPNVRDLESASENQATTLERQNSKETPRPRLERMDTSSSFVTDVWKLIETLSCLRIVNLNGWELFSSFEKNDHSNKFIELIKSHVERGSKFQPTQAVQGVI